MKHNSCARKCIGRMRNERTGKKTNEKNGKHDWQRKIGNVNKKSSHLQYNLINTFFSTLSLLLLLVHRTDTHTHISLAFEKRVRTDIYQWVCSLHSMAHIYWNHDERREEKKYEEIVSHTVLWIPGVTHTAKQHIITVGKFVIRSWDLVLLWWHLYEPRRFFSVFCYIAFRQAGSSGKSSIEWMGYGMKAITKAYILYRKRHSHTNRTLPNQIIFYSFKYYENAFDAFRFIRFPCPSLFFHQTLWIIVHRQYHLENSLAFESVLTP